MIRKVLALLMTLSLLPFAAWAQEEGTAEEPWFFPRLKRRTCWMLSIV